MMTSFDSGLSGEMMAEKQLLAKGMSFVARRYRGADGEIDLIMLDDDIVVFVEVKARPHGQAGSGLMAVTPSKQRRMTHAALAFLMEREWMERVVRFDVVEVTRDGFIHIPNAFMAAQ